MDRRAFGHLLLGLSALRAGSTPTVKTKAIKPDLTADINAEQAHLVSLRDWLNSSKSNPYGAPYVPGIEALVTQSEQRIERLQSRQ